MDTVRLKRPLGLRWLLWIVLPMLLVATFAVGSVTVFKAHAVSPLSGRYNFRGITTSGPHTGLYLTGALALAFDGSGHVAGNIFGLKISTQRSAAVSGTDTGGSVTLTIGHLKGYPALVLTGGYVTTAGHHGGFDGFEGTFSLGSSSGTWEARTTTFPQLSGSWNLFGIAEHGPDTGKQFHGVLTLIEHANGQLTGIYCSATCIAVTGGRNRYGSFYFYVDVAALNQVLRLRGTFMNATASRISGSFDSLNPNVKGTSDRGYWLGH
jgi:hypothetical protein